MKTLDEVIRANKCCDHGEMDSRCEDCPYSGIGACLLEREADALYYLEEYKNKQNVGTMMLALHNVNKTVCDDCWLSREMVGEGFKQIYKKYIEEQNPPLTWDELKTMEGKPVWIEDKDCYSRWEIITGVYDDGISFGDYFLSKDEFDSIWQAYRKEKR